MKNDVRARARIIASLALLGLVALAGPAPAEAPGAPARAAKIVVNIGKFRNTKGTLGCRLYRSGETFPEGSAGSVEKRVAIEGAETRMTFEDVGAGTYAVSCMHDENDNRKLDKNFLGVPTEGYGVSNNHTYALSAPKWDESKFVVEAGKDIGLAIGLRY